MQTPEVTRAHSRVAFRCLFSPSGRTVCPLVTDSESEGFGLNVWVNWTGNELPFIMLTSMSQLFPGKDIEKTPNLLPKRLGGPLYKGVLAR